MEIKKLFNYRPDGHEITLENGDKVKIAVIRKGPRGIVSMIMAFGPIVIWEKEEADTHENDSEADLIQRTIDKLNA